MDMMELDCLSDGALLSLESSSDPSPSNPSAAFCNKSIAFTISSSAASISIGAESASFAATRADRSAAKPSSSNSRGEEDEEVDVVASSNVFSSEVDAIASEVGDVSSSSS